MILYNEKRFPEVIQFLSGEGTSDLKKERLTNDVRYQEFNEVTLGCTEYMQTAKGYFNVRGFCACRGAFLLPVDRFSAQ